ncbi:hypothetical protein TNCV_4621731 [Trichonephila clavipes]|nr:hypothetical protein TNCV_4621731 [Trichonephila clavipes]
MAIQSNPPSRKDTTHFLRDSNPGPTAQQSASPTTILDGQFSSSLRLRHRPNSVHFPDAKNRQRPCRMIMRHRDDPQRKCLAWIFSAKSKFPV